MSSMNLDHEGAQSESIQEEIDRSAARILRDFPIAASATPAIDGEYCYVWWITLFKCIQQSYSTFRHLSLYRLLL